MVVLLVGGPGVGKTTIAKALQKEVANSAVVDGDEVRDITGNHSYTLFNRGRNMNDAFKIARSLESETRLVIISLQAPLKELRKKLLNSEDVVVLIKNSGYNSKIDLPIADSVDYTDVSNSQDLVTFDAKTFVERFLKLT